jgi:RHS repeat-associated protein
MHVKIVGTATESFFEYAHRDHLGSIEAVTDGNGNVLDNLAFEAFGARKAENWTGSIPSTELDALLALESGHSRKVRGFTGHEHLDRSGFIHMNGRVYDPLLGRFLSPDPIVQFPAFSQSWNRYSYLNNTPTSFTDPTGYFGNETMEEIVVTGSRGSNLGSSNSMLHAMGSLSVSNGGGIGSGGGRSEGGFGAGATAPTDTEATEAGESVIDEIVLTESAMPFHGVGSGIVYTGFSGSYSYFGLFDGAGGAGVVAISAGSDSLYWLSNGLNAASFAFGSGELSRVRNGSWRGKNGKWNSLTWGGNQHTGSRSAVIRATNALKIAGRASLAGALTMSAIEGASAFGRQDSYGVANAGIDATMGFVGAFGGLPGLVISGLYFLTDATIGMDTFSIPVTNIMCYATGDC